MPLPSDSEVLSEAERTVRSQGRAALCQVVRTEGSTPGRPGWKLLVRPDGSRVGNLGGGAFEAMVERDAAAKLEQVAPRAEIKRYYLTEKAVQGEATGMVCGGMVEVFLEVLTARELLVSCGGGPVGQALAANAMLCGFDVAVVEDRDEFLRRELFPPGVERIAVDREMERDFLAAYAGRELYVAVVSRCWETDLAALAAVARQQPSGLRYLGLMGSERKVERLRRELAERGIDIDEHGLIAPIGLPIGGETPGELAVSILAQMIERRAALRRAEAAADESDESERSTARAADG
ncbi:MAG: XdhC/CoxI family protein [Thermoanaerobaculia bacterium]|nr:XdhC/CoxI family protein [Thermoanaerobaculia bacterium]